MNKVTAHVNLTLDGVMQAPARPDEDRRGGFKYGGWALPYADPAAGKNMAENMSGPGLLLFGRRTYEDFYAVWPQRPDNPFSQILNRARKYVASTTLQEPLAWENSTLLSGDAAEAVARLKQQAGKDLVILGSGELVLSLMRHGLVDEFVLSIHPLILGAGRRLFPEGCLPATFKVVESRTTDAGVVVVTYYPIPTSR